MRTDTWLFTEQVKRIIPKRRPGGIRAHFAALAVLVMVCLMVTVLFCQNTHAGPDKEPVSGSVASGLTANRCILISDRITPGSQFTVMVVLQANSMIKDVELREDFPNDWAIFPLDGEGAKVHAIQPDFSEFKWMWRFLPAGEATKVFYQVTVPSSAEVGNYSISGKIIFSDKTLITVGGEASVDVKNPAQSAMEFISPSWLLLGIALIIIFTFIFLVFLGWWKDKSLNKGEMRRAIAGTFVVGFTILTMLSIIFGLYEKEIILMYVQLAGVVVAFYFGARIAKENGTLAPAEKPIVQSIIPSKGKDVVSVVIEGRNFAPGSQIRLRQSGQDDIPAFVKEKDFSSTKMNSVFNFTGKTGMWKVIVINPDKKESEPVLFTVE